MELKDDVISLGLAKQLKEVGVPQSSLFYWFVHKTNGNSKLAYKTDDGFYSNSGAIFSESTLESCDIISAYTCSELGEIMKGKGMGVTAFASIGKEGWWVRGGEWIVEKQQYSHLESEPKWADALAKMLLHLIQNNLISPSTLSEGR